MIPSLKALVLLVVFGASAQGAITLDISGGSGSPLSITIVEPITYTVTEAAPSGPVIFIFSGVAPSSPTVTTGVSGTVTFSINGAGTYTLNQMYSGFASNDLSPDDLVIYGPAFFGLNVGDIITMSAGTLTTTSSLATAFAPLSGGSVDSFAATGAANILTNAAVPEPSSALLIGLGCAGVFFLRRRVA